MESATINSTQQQEHADLLLCASRRKWKINDVSKLVKIIDEKVSGGSYHDFWLALLRLSERSGIVSIVQEVDLDCSVVWNIYPAGRLVAPVFTCSDLLEATTICAVLNLMIYDIKYLAEGEHGES